jgi:predicted nucleic acid-binding protein
VSIVLDASLALTWCFDDESREDTIAVGERILEEGAYVATHFHLEIANALVIAERKLRISRAEANARLERLALMPFVVDDVAPEAAWQNVIPLARLENLTAYDAAYLELALRIDAELATLDGPLIAAARRRGLTLLP